MWNRRPGTCVKRIRTRHRPGVSWWHDCAWAYHTVLAFFDAKKKKKKIVSFVLVGLGKAYSPTSSDRGKNSAISNFGPRVDTCSDIETVTPCATFFSFAFPSRSVFAKTDKNKGRHQAKDHAQFLLLRDSFLDLIPALCFRIHWRENGSLCQSIQLVGCHKADIGDEL